MRPALEAMYDEFRYPYLDEWRVPCVVLANDDPEMPWNSLARRDDPLAPWNDPRYAADPYAPWNDPLAGEAEYQTYCDQKWIAEHER